MLAMEGAIQIAASVTVSVDAHLCVHEHRQSLRERPLPASKPSERLHAARALALSPRLPLRRNPSLRCAACRRRPQSGRLSRGEKLATKLRDIDASLAEDTRGVWSQLGMLRRHDEREMGLVRCRRRSRALQSSSSRRRQHGRKLPRSRAARGFSRCSRRQACGWRERAPGPWMSSCLKCLACLRCDALHFICLHVYPHLSTAFM